MPKQASKSLEVPKHLCVRMMWSLGKKEFWVRRKAGERLGNILTNISRQIATEAIDICAKEGRKTVRQEDIIYASVRVLSGKSTSAVFDTFVEPDASVFSSLRDVVHKYLKR